MGVLNSKWLFISKHTVDQKCFGWFFSNYSVFILLSNPWCCCLFSIASLWYFYLFYSNHSNALYIVLFMHWIKNVSIHILFIEINSFWLKRFLLSQIAICMHWIKNISIHILFIEIILFWLSRFYSHWFQSVYIIALAVCRDFTLTDSNKSCKDTVLVYVSLLKTLALHLCNDALWAVIFFWRDDSFLLFHAAVEVAVSSTATTMTKK